MLICRIDALLRVFADGPLRAEADRGRSPLLRANSESQERTLSALFQRRSNVGSITRHGLSAVADNAWGVMRPTGLDSPSLRVPPHPNPVPEGEGAVRAG